MVTVIVDITGPKQSKSILISTEHINQQHCENDYDSRHQHPRLIITIIIIPPPPPPSSPSARSVFPVCQCRGHDSDDQGQCEVLHELSCLDQPCRCGKVRIQCTFVGRSNLGRPQAQSKLQLPLPCRDKQRGRGQGRDCASICKSKTRR